MDSQFFYFIFVNLSIGVEMIEQSDNLSSKDRSFLRLAMKAASASECMQKHGAVIVRSGSVLAIGINKWKGHSVRHTSVHAEMDALSRVKDADGCTMYVARVNKRGEARFSRPCDDCYLEMLKAGVKRVVFSTIENGDKNGPF